MKVLTIILTAITLSQSSYAIFNENFYKSDRIKKLVTDQFEASKSSITNSWHSRFPKKIKRMNTL